MEALAAGARRASLLWAKVALDAEIAGTPRAPKLILTAQGHRTWRAGLRRRASSVVTVDTRVAVARGQG
jgi:hypothetical protein